jgi:hypothetical protein
MLPSHTCPDHANRFPMDAEALRQYVTLSGAGADLANVRFGKLGFGVSFHQTKSLTCGMHCGRPRASVHSSETKPSPFTKTLPCLTPHRHLSIFKSQRPLLRSRWIAICLATLSTLFKFPSLPRPLSAPASMITRLAIGAHDCLAG